MSFGMYFLILLMFHGEIGTFLKYKNRSDVAITLDER